MGLSPWEVFSFLPATGLVVSTVTLTALTSPFRGKDQAKTISEHIRRNAFRTAFTDLTVSQLQTILPSTEASYRAEAKKVGEPALVVDIPNTPDNVKGLWLGDRSKASVYLIYLHGGGFVLPAVDGHIQLLRRIVGWSNGKVAIFVPTYSLSPAVNYPQPIREVAEAVKYVAGLTAATASGNNGTAKELALAGDSAGGNLVLAVLSLLSGHALKVGDDDKDVIQPFELPRAAGSGPLFKSVLAIAPWVSSNYDKFPHMVQASTRDLLSHKILEYWSSVHRGTVNIENSREFFTPEVADPTWWEPVARGNKVGSVLVVAGDDEVLRDPILSWYGKFEKGLGGSVPIHLLVAKGEIHDQPLAPKSEAELDALGEAETQEGAIKRWVQELVK